MGTGAVNNAGTLRLGSSVQYQLQHYGVTSPAAAANPLHIVNLPAALYPDCIRQAWICV